MSNVQIEKSIATNTTNVVLPIRVWFAQRLWERGREYPLLNGDCVEVEATVALARRTTQNPLKEEDVIAVAESYFGVAVVKNEVVPTAERRGFVRYSFYMVGIRAKGLTAGDITSICPGTMELFATWTPAAEGKERRSPTRPWAIDYPATGFQDGQMTIRSRTWTDRNDQSHEDQVMQLVVTPANLGLMSAWAQVKIAMCEAALLAHMKAHGEAMDTKPAETAKTVRNRGQRATDEAFAN